MEQHKKKVVKVSVEVRNGTARFRVGVQARSIREALSLVGAKDPQREVRVVFPLEPAGLFVRQLATGQTQQEAA